MRVVYMVSLAILLCASVGNFSSAHAEQGKNIQSGGLTAARRVVNFNTPRRPPAKKSTGRAGRK
ncbi:MAG: hypothetical protein SF339_24540 [Blastocatellia bacterium]|nr:hypothetical protein [Blastocatellia bacterium]